MSNLSVRSLLPANFFEVYWRRQPLLLRGAAAAFDSLIGDDEIEAYENDYFAAPAAWRTNSIGRIGSTSYLANGECINEELAAFCSTLRTEFRWPYAEIAMVRNREETSWVTSGPHYDQIDNFIVQHSGRKEWRLWATDDVAADDKRQRVLRTPGYGETPVPAHAPDLVEVVLEPGDLMYLPVFWGHSVRALGPGIMLSIGLKALLPRQAVLHGLTSTLVAETAGAVPIPLPDEVDDWNGLMATMTAAELASLAKPPAVVDSGPSAGTMITAGVTAMASTRHQLLLKTPTSEGHLQPVRHLDVLDQQLDAIHLDLAAAFDVTGTGLVVVRDLFALVHLRRFLSLVSFGPQPWWAAEQSQGWTELRHRIEAKDLEELIQAAGDPGLVRLTTAFRDNLRAFSRRQALKSLTAWVDALETNGRPASFVVSVDAAGGLPATQGDEDRISAALAAADAVLPGFTEAFTTLISTVTVDRLGRQTVEAMNRPRAVAVNPDWSRDELAAALAGELARVGAQLLSRIGVHRPGAEDRYRGELPHHTGFERAAALVGKAGYLAATDSAGAASVCRELATGLVREELYFGHLTTLGRSACEAMLSRIAGTEPPAPIAVAPLLDELDRLERTDAHELVRGHVQPTARFWWSDLRTERGPAPEDQFTAGMDCGIQPWLAL